jgi:hypothetical protein
MAVVRGSDGEICGGGSDGGRVEPGLPGGRVGDLGAPGLFRIGADGGEDFESASMDCNKRDLRIRG